MTGLLVMNMLSAPPPSSRFERVAGKRQGHTCTPPGAIVRFLRRVRVGDVWACACAQRWRWGIDPLASRYGFQQREWVRL